MGDPLGFSKLQFVAKYQKKIQSHPGLKHKKVYP